MSEKSGSSAQTMFHVAKNEETFGPWGVAEIARRLATGELTVTDFVYDEVRADWITLLECQPLKEHLNRAKPKAPPRTQASHKVEVKVEMVPPTPQAVESREAVKGREDIQAKAVSAPMQVVETASSDERSEWFVMKGDHRYGPFTYTGLVRAMQSKSVYDFDFVWREGMNEWVRIAEHKDFTPERIRDLLQNTEDDATVFFRRQHPRVRIEGDVLVHDDRAVWSGRACEGSVGGSGLWIENATLVPGQVIRVHFSSLDGCPSFNALGEIVSKQYAKDLKGARSPVKYGIRFLRVEAGAETRVTEYFRSRAA